MIFISPTNSDNFVGVKIDDSFQLTYDFSGEFPQSYTLPYTRLALVDMAQSITVEYIITDIFTDVGLITYVQLNLESDEIIQIPYEITSPLNLIESYHMSNGTRLQPPLILSLDFMDQFEDFFLIANKSIAINNSTIVVDLGYLDDLDFFEFYIVTNHTYTSESSAIQENVIRYYKETGILESYESHMIWDGYQGTYDNLVAINNTGLQNDSNPSDNSSWTNATILLLLIVGGYIAYNSKIKKKKIIDSKIDIGGKEIANKSQMANQHEETSIAKPIEKVEPKIVKVILCPTCNSTNAIDSNYCLECGIFIRN